MPDWLEGLLGSGIDVAILLGILASVVRGLVDYYRRRPGQGRPAAGPAAPRRQEGARPGPASGPRRLERPVPRPDGAGEPGQPLSPTAPPQEERQPARPASRPAAEAPRTPTAWPGGGPWGDLWGDLLQQMEQLLRERIEPRVPDEPALPPPVRQRGEATPGAEGRAGEEGTPGGEGVPGGEGTAGGEGVGGLEGPRVAAARAEERPAPSRPGPSRPAPAEDGGRAGVLQPPVPPTGPAPLPGLPSPVHAAALAPEARRAMVRRAWMWMEVLGPPRSLRPWVPPGPGGARRP
ncbi:hypothetical protein [Thermaerobacter litoralis]